MMELNTPLKIVDSHIEELSFWIEDADGEQVADDGSAGGEYGQTMSREAARRFVACVNACAGISQQYLEELNGEPLISKQLDLLSQRDQLLAAAKKSVADNESCVAALDEMSMDWLDDMKAAIAAVEQPSAPWPEA